MCVSLCAAWSAGCPRNPPRLTSRVPSAFSSCIWPPFSPVSFDSSSPSPSSHRPTTLRSANSNMWVSFTKTNNKCFFLLCKIKLKKFQDAWYYKKKNYITNETLLIFRMHSLSSTRKSCSLRVKDPRKSSLFWRLSFTRNASRTSIWMLFWGWIIFFYRSEG